MTQRDFEIKLGLLVMETLATGLSADKIIISLREKLTEEETLQKARRRHYMSY